MNNVIENDLTWYFENFIPSVKSVFNDLKFTNISSQNFSKFYTFNENFSHLDNSNYDDNFLDYLDKKNEIEKILNKIPHYYKNILFSIYAVPSHDYPIEILNVFKHLTGPACNSKLIKSQKELKNLCTSQDPKLSLIFLRANKDLEKSISLYLKYKNEA